MVNTETGQTIVIHVLKWSYLKAILNSNKEIFEKDFGIILSVFKYAFMVKQNALS